jgi:hypothetical protein
LGISDGNRAHHHGHVLLLHQMLHRESATTSGMVIAKLHSISLANSSRWRSFIMRVGQHAA